MVDVLNEEPSMDSHDDLVRISLQHAALKAEAIRIGGTGGIVNIIGDPSTPSEESDIVKAIIEHSGIERTDVEVINIEHVLNALELGIGRDNLEIPEDQYEAQSLLENVFQYVYRGFGKEGKGWRIGIPAAVTHLIEMSSSFKTNLRGSVFDEFLQTLDLDFGNNTDTKGTTARMRVLYFPPIIDDLSKRQAFHLEKLDKKQADKARNLLRVFSIINQVYPSRFDTDNPAGNVIVNVADPSYQLFSVANSEFSNNNYTFQGAIETASATEKMKRLTGKI